MLVTILHPIPFVRIRSRNSLILFTKSLENDILEPRKALQFCCSYIYLRENFYFAMIPVIRPPRLRFEFGFRISHRTVKYQGYRPDYEGGRVSLSGVMLIAILHLFDVALSLPGSARAPGRVLSFEWSRQM